MKRSMVLTVGAAVAMMVLAGCTPATQTDPSQQLVLGVAVEPTTFDPGELQGGGQLQYWGAVYDTLLLRAPDGTVSPNAAEEWEYSDDLRTLTLTLREGMTFTDDSPVTADAVAQSLTRFRDGTSPDASYLEAVSDIVALDERQLQLTLTEPDPALLIYLTTSGGAFGNPAEFDEDIAQVPAGSGPYTLDEARTVPGSEYVFVRNDDYWNPDQYEYDEVVLRPMAESTARLNALRSGQIDSAVLDVQSIDALGDGFDVVVQSSAWEGLYLLDRAGETVPALGDARVRQAINLAIDRQGIVDQLLLGYGEATDQMFPPTSPAYREDLVGAYDHSPERARALMAEAGYADGFDLAMPSSSAFQYLEPTLADALGQIGIRVQWETVPADQLIQRLLDREWPVFMFRHAQDSAWVDLSRQVRPEALWNLYGSTDPQLDALLAEVQAAPDEESASDAYAGIGGFLVEQAWFAPLWYNQQANASMSSVVVTPQVGTSIIPLRNYGL